MTARRESPTRLVPLLVSLLLFASVHASVQAPSVLAATARGDRHGRGHALAYTPYAIWSGGEIAARLGLAQGAIYVLDGSARSGGGGRILGDPKQYWAADARVSPRGDLIAFHGKMTPPVGSGDEGIGVMDTDGELVTFITGGATFAWSPGGRRLAVVVSGSDALGSSTGRGVILWDRRDRSRQTFEALPSRVGWAGEDSLLLQLGDRVDVVDPRSGDSSATGHHGTVVSPDGLYSMWPGEGGRNTRILDDETNRDVTNRLFGPLERRGLREIRSAFWVQGSGADHFMCVSGSDHLYLGYPRCTTAIIDADTGETIGSFPGEALGPCGDGKSTVVLRHESDQFETVNLEEIVRRWIRGGAFY